MFPPDPNHAVLEELSDGPAARFLGATQDDPVSDLKPTLRFCQPLPQAAPAAESWHSGK